MHTNNDQKPARSYGASLEERREELQDYVDRLRTGACFNEQMKDVFFDESKAEKQLRHQRNARLANQIEKDMKEDPSYDGYGEIGYTVVKNNTPPIPAPYINIDQTQIVSISRPSPRLLTTENWRSRRDEHYASNYHQNDVSFDPKYEQTKIGIEKLARMLSQVTPTGAIVSDGWSGDDDGYYIDFYFTDMHGFDGQYLADSTGLPVKLMDDYSVRIYYEDDT